MSNTNTDFDNVFAEGETPAAENAAKALRQQRETQEAAATGEFTSAFDKEETPAGEDKEAQ